jgi:hypothetical protein
MNGPGASHPRPAQGNREGTGGTDAGTPGRPL